MRPGVVAVLLLGLLACGPVSGGAGNPPAAAPAGATTAVVTSASTTDGGDQSWRAEWDRTVAAAKREGRLDVPAGTPEIAANPHRQYIERNREEYLPYWDKTAQLARELAR
jgi:hypothetical protein